MGKVHYRHLRNYYHPYVSYAHRQLMLRFDQIFDFLKKRQKINIIYFFIRRRT